MDREQTDTHDIAQNQTPVLSSLQTDVAHKVAGLIKQGRWQPGERISDSALAKELSVSRSPVRFVLTLLAHYGLVAHLPGRGFQLVRTMLPDETIDALVPQAGTERLVNRLMEARASGAIGEEVSESELVEQFGTTRGAVRRALMQFAAEGLAERLPGHGWRFAESLDNDRAVNESYAFRLVVECGALLQPGYAPREEELEAVRREQNEILRKPVDQLARDDWFNANANFHETVVSWAGNRFFTQAVRRQNQLRRMTEYADFGKLGEQRLREACRDHLRILDAIEEGDHEFAAALLRRHIARSGMDI